jgi:type IV pilus assembly protein PilY1
MKTFEAFFRASKKPQRWSGSLAGVAAILTVGLATTGALAQTPLANQPLLTANEIPGNLALALSVEFPTAISVAHISATYTATNTYLGYFDPAKCYSYRSGATDSTTAPNTTAPDSYFYPDGAASATHTCTSKWSGNFLNWATMQTIDPFRWALTGGYRVIDNPDLTVLEKAWAPTGQGSTTNFPDRSIASSTTISGATPLEWNNLTLSVFQRGNKLRFYRSGSSGTPVHYAGVANNNTVYEVFVRAKVCDPAEAAGGLETNCTRYGSNYKPEGLIQKYANKIRYSAFGYLNDGNLRRDGAALRARQKFIGPVSPVPGSTPVTNARSEWDATTGVFVVNPDSADATDTATIFGTIPNSGVMNYLNKFGQSGSYKTYDPVGELYYAAVRYFKNLGNVPEWTAVGTADAATRATWADRFPVITSWDDPILYSCQRNFILGIGDTHSHADANVARTDTPAGGSEPAMPSAVSSDTSVNAVTATNRVGTIQGIANLGTARPWGAGSNNNTALMAGLAYDSHTMDIRPDVASQPKTIGKQTIDTYWLDVQEYQELRANNQFMLAAKYGGFAVPDGYEPYSRTTALPEAWWSTSGDVLNTTNNDSPTTQPRPDNYFLAGAPDKMVAGLNTAFGDIASSLTQTSTGAALSSPQVTALGNTSFSSLYDASNWTSEIRRDTLTLPDTGPPTTVVQWSFPGTAATQFGNSGWNTDRRIVTWNPSAASGGTGVPFRIASLSASQVSALDTPYRTGDDSADFLNYLRGQRTHEQASTATSSSRAYRTRASLLGDIVDSKLVPIGKPSFPYREDFNPGYRAFKTAWENRPTVVYVGANDGMMHAINAADGTELFAYVPSAVFRGPNGTPAEDGLAALGNPSYVHRYFVNSTPSVFDIDLSNTVGVTAGTAPNWRSVLVGGLGKGGKSYYAIDVTDPASMTTEAAVASKVLWEFTDPDLGFTYDGPVIAKTSKYGWVFVFPSGYNNADGRGYLFFVNPRTGALLEKVTTGVGTSTVQAGLAYANGYVPRYGEQMIDSIYAGDLLGNVWRLDVTAASGNYPAPELFARLTDSNGNGQPVSSRPVIETDLDSRNRYVFIGTGRLLDTSDITSTRRQAFYALRDGNNVRFNRSTDPGMTLPITPAMLSQITDPLVGAPGVPAIGWYLNQDYVDGLGWRSISRPNASYAPLVLFTSILMTNANVCEPSGQSRIYGLRFSTGQSMLYDIDPNGVNGSDAVRQTYVSVDGIVLSTQILNQRPPGPNDPPGPGDEPPPPPKPRAICDTSAGEFCGFEFEKRAGQGLRRMNWREIPVAD